MEKITYYFGIPKNHQMQKSTLILINIVGKLKGDLGSRK